MTFGIEYYYDECHYAGPFIYCCAECHYAVCHYPECRYDECCGAICFVLHSRRAHLE